MFNFFMEIFYRFFYKLPLKLNILIKKLYFCLIFARNQTEGNMQQLIFFNNTEFLMKKLSTMILIIFLLMPALAMAKGYTDIEDIRENLPKMLGANSQGTEFVLTFHPCWEESGANNALKIYVSSGEQTSVTLEVPALGHIETKVTVPYDIIEFSLEPGIGQPYRKSDREPPLDEQVFPGRGIIVTADAPIVAYGVTRYRYTSDGYLALPTSSLGNHYIVSSWEDVVSNTGSSRIQWLTSYTSIVAAYDETRVRFTMGGNMNSKTPLGLKPGDSRTEIMQRGDVFTIPAMGPYSDITGSVVESNKPVAVISGSFCAYVPRDVPACDFMIEQDLPSFTWGTEYHMTPIVDRDKNSWMRVYAKTPNTRVYRDGNQIATIQNAGGTEGYGWLSRRADVDNAPKRALTISGNKGIVVMQYNTGQNDDGVESDPFMLTLTPIQQYQDEIIFNTPGIQGGVGFKHNYVNIVYKATPDGGIPDNLEFGRVVDGDISWQPLAGFDSHPGEIFANSVGADGRPYKAKTIKLPVDGVYKLRAQDKFAAYAYGFDWYDSYGFPTSVALADLETPDTVAPQPNWTMDCYGSVPENPQSPEDAYVEDWGTDPNFPPNDPERTSNLGLIYFNQKESFNYDFGYDEFVPGVDRSTNWWLKVRDISSDARAVIVFTDRAGNDTTIEVRYYTTNLAVRNSYHNYGALKVGDPSVTEEFTVTNRSTEYPAVIENIYIKDSEPSFSLNPNGLIGATLAPLESRTIEVTYTPLSNSSVADSIIVEAWGMDQDCLFRFGSVIEASAGTPRIYADNHNFLEYTVSETTPYTDLVVANREQDGGTQALKITEVQFSENVGLPGSGKTFEVDGLQDISEESPLVIEAGAEYGFRVRFTPDSVADFNGRIDFISDAKDNGPKPFTILNGRGIQPSLMANSGDWNEKRVKIARHDAITHPDYNFTFPYSSIQADIDPYGNAVAELRNDGTKEVTLANPVILEDVNGSAFKAYVDGELRPLNDQTVLNQLFQNKQIQPSQTMTVEYYFQPEETDNGEGEHRLVIEYPSDAPENPQTVLEGTGLYPISSTSDVAFGETIVGADAVEMQVTFTNTNWDWEDDLTIYDLETDGRISDDIGAYGTEHFAYDKSAIGFPVVLAPGEALTFTAYFQPDEDGVFEGDITTVSDAQQEVTSVWTGSSVIQSVATAGDNTVICKGENPVLISTYENTGTDDLEVTASLTTDAAGDNPYTGNSFTFDDNADMNFTIAAGETRQIEIAYAPDWANEAAVSGNPSVYVRYESDAYSDNLETSPIEVSWEGYPRTSVGKVNGADEVSLALGKIEDSKFEYSVYIEQFGPQMDNARNQMNINELYLTIKYDTKFMSAIGIEDDLAAMSETILSDELYNLGYRITDMTRYLRDGEEADQYKLEEINMTIGGGAGLIENAEIPVLTAEFALLLPNMVNEDESGQYVIEGNESMIYHSLETSNEPCVVIEDGTMPTVIREEVCVDNLRKIVVGPDFSLGSIDPNPVGPTGGDLEFGVGIEAQTSIKIYNTAGELMSQPVNGMMRPGKYTISIPVEDLPSGVYFYEMESGPYKEVKKMIIQK